MEDNIEKLDAKLEEDVCCCRCNEKMIPLKKDFEYMGRRFQHELLTCPKCGQSYLPKELAEGKMRKLEETLEIK